MSSPPTPPKCIAEALIRQRAFMPSVVDAGYKPTVPPFELELIEQDAQAVWDALLAEGEKGVQILHHTVVIGLKRMKPGQRPVLVLPLPALGDDPQEAHRASRVFTPEEAAAIAECPTPVYHETHRYCPACPWTEEFDA